MNENTPASVVVTYLLLTLGAFVYSIYFLYRIAVTVHAWPFG